MGFQIRGIDHERLLIRRIRSQSLEDPSKRAHLASALPPVVESLGRSILTGRIAPPQPIPVDEDYAA